MRPNEKPDQEKTVKGKDKKDFKGKKPFKPKESDKFPKHNKGANDPAWYFKYPELAKLASRIAFNRRNGGITDMVYGRSSGARNMDPILTYLYLLTPGYSYNGDSGVNVTSYAAWKMLNRRFRGVSKYQQSDFGIIQFGILDLFASIAEAERIYGVLNHYSLNNKQVPSKLLIAMGVDPFAFTDLADFRLRLNRLILEAKTLCLVKGYGLLDHALLLASNVFKDKDNPRAQLFVFNRPGFWLYDPTVSTGSALVFKRFETETRLTYTNQNGSTKYMHLRTQDTIIRDLTTQINALITDDDVDNVCSDILAFYGNKEEPAELVSLSLLPEDYEVIPVYSDSINRQVHNSTCICNENLLGSPASEVAIGGTELIDWTTVHPSSVSSTIAGLLIYQYNNQIMFNMSHYQGTAHVFGFGGLYYTVGEGTDTGGEINKPIIDTDMPAPTEEDVMEMTRLTFITEAERSDGNVDGVPCYHLPLATFGSVVVLQMIACEFTENQLVHSSSSGVGYNYEITQIGLIIGVAATGYGSYTIRESMLAKYDWTPIRYNTMSNVLCINADLDNYVAIDATTLKEMHDIAIISEFKNPISDFLIKE